jgi:hypothetical protein
VVPPTIAGEVGSSPPTPAGYGIRVPGLVISPYAKRGYVDHQTLSHDAYLKFIEDAFLGGRRLDPATDGRPDSRPDVRENAPVLGDLQNDFDFSQAPLPPLVLPTHPAPGPASCPPGGCPVPPLQLIVNIARTQHIRGRHPAITLVLGCNVACAVQLGGRLSLGRRHRQRRLQTAHLLLAANHSIAEKLNLTRSSVRAIRRAQRRHQRVFVTIQVTAQAGGASTTYAVQVRLRR